jgi:tRNA (guanine-N7-)-methyltransferase
MIALASATHPDGAAFWTELFGDPAPVEIEIGSGDGAFLLARATATPRRNLLGIERSPGKSRRLAARIGRLGSPHVRTLQADAAYVLEMVPAGSVSAVHVYFPDPWPKRRHVPRRIFSPAFVAALARVLLADGTLHVATDVEPYMARIRAVVLADRRFAEISAGDDHPGLSTGFARKYRAEGRVLHTASFRRAAEAQPLPAAVKIRSS